MFYAYIKLICDILEVHVICVMLCHLKLIFADMNLGILIPFLKGV